MTPIPIMTPDRAEKLIRAWESRGCTVTRILRHLPAADYRTTVTGLLIAIRPYARIFMNGRLRATIYWESIDAGSILL